MKNNLTNKIWKEIYEKAFLIDFCDNTADGIEDDNTMNRIVITTYDAIKIIQNNTMEKIKNKSCLFVHDTEDENDYPSLVEKPLADNGLFFENIKITDKMPSENETFDVLFFDWGGLS